jgi:hypothetical protein
MSERTFTISMTGPQYRALASAVARAEVDLDDNRQTQERQTLERAWNRVQAGWNMGGARYAPPAARHE